MKIRFISFVALILLALLAQGCASMVMPYNEAPLCNKGIYGGYCASLSEVYDAVSEDIKKNRSYVGPIVHCNGDDKCQ